MHVASAHFLGYKRFTDTQIDSIPVTARLVVLAGPNGCGKSSIFDAFRVWHGLNGLPGYGWDESYGTKVGTPPRGWPDHVKVTFHEVIPEGPEEKKKLIYIRSAFRHEADFQVSSFNRLNSPLDTVRFQRLIDADSSVSDNYQRLIMQSIDGIYDDKIPDTITKAQLRDRIIGEARRAMEGVFPDLMIAGVGGIGGSDGSVGSFYFDKGTSRRFLFKNLSAGEKAGFDLILDFVIKREFYDNTIWCIDEPESHLNTRVQGLLLQTLVELLPSTCQLWIASHSIGFMREAWEMSRRDPSQVTFIDLQGIDFDQPTVITPVHPTRDFWAKTLDIALGDIASLVAPEQAILCEGRPPKGGNDRKAEFDARCYRRIFAHEYPNADFISVGNSFDAMQDRLDFGTAIQTLASGTRVTRVIDRDMRNKDEVTALEQSGIKVLSRRHIESYLLDDEVVSALCQSVNQPDKVEAALQIKKDELAASVSRGNDVDDYKSAAGGIYTSIRRLLSLSGAGSDWTAFATGTLAGLLRSGMTVYDELRADIFDS